MKPHSAALTQPPTGPKDTPYPDRLQLTREQVSWQTPVPDYAPEDFTAPEADPADGQAPISYPKPNANPNPNPNSNLNPYPNPNPYPYPNPNPYPYPYPNPNPYPYPYP